MENKYIEDDHIIYVWYDGPLFRGWIAFKPPVPKAKPWLEYKGPKRLLEDWRQQLAFFIWSFKDCKSETQVRWYLNQEEGIWKPWAFPQEYNTGMSAKEIDERCDEEREKVGLDRHWLLGGTDHHHNTSSAWQSDTDTRNEKTQYGLHITVGHLDKEALSIHGRVYFKGAFYPCDWGDWFEMPPGLEGLPAEFKDKVMEHFLTQPPDENQVFPKEWKENVIKKVYAPTPSHPSLRPIGGPGAMGWYGGGYGGGHWGGGDYSEVEVEADANEGKAPKHLSRKEKKRRKLQLRKLGIQKLAKNYNVEELQCLADAAKRVNALLARLGKSITLQELVRWTTLETNMLGVEQNNALDDFETILRETGADPEGVQDWIETAATLES